MSIAFATNPYNVRYTFRSSILLATQHKNQLVHTHITFNLPLANAGPFQYQKSPFRASLCTVTEISYRASHESPQTKTHITKRDPGVLSIPSQLCAPASNIAIVAPRSDPFFFFGTASTKLSGSEHLCQDPRYRWFCSLCPNASLHPS
jgi:hypothetical protein